MSMPTSMPRPPSSRSSRRRARPPVPRSPAVALSRGLAFLAIPLARAQWQQPSGSRGAPQQQWQPPPPPQQWEWAREGDAAADGEAAPDPPAHEACAGCNEPPDKVCAETATTTLAEGECLQCSVAGTTWYPCSLVGECYCKTPTSSPTESTVPPTPAPTALSTANATMSPEQAEALFDDPRCDEARCYNTFYEDCFHETSRECSDPVAAAGGEGGAEGESKEEVVVVMVEEEVIPPGPPPDPTPEVLEGVYVLDAHLAANKIALSRELLSAPGRRDAGFRYADLRDALRAMATVGASGKLFFVGGREGNGRAHGLVNLAAFLAAAAEDSVRAGGCDEISADVVDGVLPLSNACGQHGRNYQDPERCPLYACAPDPTMRAEAGTVVQGDWWDGDSGDRAQGAGYVPPPPFKCGPKSDFEGGTTGHWDFVSGTEGGLAARNAKGKDNVEGCCWWGRGAVQVRGACAYGMLNYFLGRRAHDEGRHALYPDVDFCRDPQAVCADARHPELRWTVGLFRWVTEVQAYSKDGFDYLEELARFVDGGMADGRFAHGVAAIVAQGCHDPPCAGDVEAKEFDGAGRMATFRKTLKLLGLVTGEGTDTERL